MNFAKWSAIIKSCSQDYPDVTFSDMIETSNNFLKIFRKNTAVDKVELISIFWIRESMQRNFKMILVSYVRKALYYLIQNVQICFSHALITEHIRKI